jgi:eukaryotic-like serine/threonine-protein kinase
MQTDCPRCRRVLEYSGDRPSFCAYCGSPLGEADQPAGVLPLVGDLAQVDTDLEQTGPMPSPNITDTVEYRSTRPTTAAGVEEFPERVAGYRLVRRLGSGGMGTVFEAEDEAQAQRVALKLIARDHMTSSEAVERFRQEGRLASAVTHPRCVFVLAVDDDRGDVYSVAATLYYLIAGRPPVQAKDAAEALARIASEPAPPLRGYRPDIHRALEAVIHRGLERDPARRWRNLQEFHDALVPFVPDRLSIAGIGLRVGAYVVDIALAYLVSWAIFGLILLYHQSQVMETLRFYELNSDVLGWIERVLWFFYFVLLEGIGGASLGKWLAGLRVNRIDRGGPPGLGRGLVRSLVFYALTELPADLIDELLPPVRGPRMFLKFWAYERIVRGLGLVALISTMRQKTGFRGPHEWLSGTRVVRVIRFRRPRPTRRLQAMTDSRLASEASAPPPQTLGHVGPYEVRDTLRWEPEQKILLGQDSTLERPVWIVVREPEAKPPSPARRSLNRQSRPRWIGGGDDEGRWDAFTAPSGFPLAELVKAEGLPWRDVLPMVRQLAEELQAARDDGTLPRRLSTEQIWIQPDGGVQLIDFLDETDNDPAVPASRQPAADETAASTQESLTADLDEHQLLAFLGEVARLALEGRRYHHPAPPHTPPRALRAGAQSRGGEGQSLPWFPAAWGRRIRAAVPERSGLILERLTGVRTPFPALASLRAELDSAAGRPTEISLVRRGIHLGIQTFFLLPGLFLMFLLSSGTIRPHLFPWDLAAVVAIPVCWVVWAFVARGGLSYPLAGIALVRGDGRRASRRACGWRAFLVWAAPTFLLASARYVHEALPEATGLSLGLWFGTLLLLLGYVALTLLFPSRCIQDRLAGTLLVPL